MNTPYIAQHCVCSKCSHSWNTKTEILPRACPKCGRVTWNDDSLAVKPIDTPANDAALPVASPQAALKVEKVVAPTIEIVESLQAIEIDPIADDDATESENVPNDNQWLGWSNEIEEYDGESGDIITLRVHLKTKRREIIRREPYIG